eukprot:TRINITY_DN3541_c0_g1_i1.p1 TRINITY_DN3541_c0_g1~~TRINITY_DN3541_c0_g1_i1.p1  ORF type:complete len:295 (-),score=86.44 TRINITY_DN3541_c0_g1_i1:74-958(-)
MNSLESAYMCLERPIVFGELKQIQKKLKKEGIVFPLIQQNYYPHHREMIITPDFPLVGKIGHAHAGYGKMKIKSDEEIQDFKSIIAINNDYVTLEPFVQWDFDMRIQKIGRDYRGFKRTSPNWKGNTGNSSVIEDLEVTPVYKRWVDECSRLFGGLDILGLDLLHSKETGRDYILELNDTAIGLVHKYEIEDMSLMRDMALAKLCVYYAPPPLPISSSSPSSSSSSSSTTSSEHKESEPDRQSNVEIQKSDAEKIKELEEMVASLEVNLAKEKKTVKDLNEQISAAKKKKGFFS